MNTVESRGQDESDVGAMAYLPVAFFGSVMGLSGLALAWRIAHLYFGTPQWIGVWIGYIGMLSFVALVVGYTDKLTSSFATVSSEFNHPIAGNLFGTPLISLLLLPILLADINLQLARILWMLGAAGMTIFAWFVVGRWMHIRHHVAHATPAWIIPLVGMLDVPLAIPSLHFQSMQGFMIFSLAVGLFFAVPLFTIILSRLIFEETLPRALEPSLLILLAPFSVGFSSYLTTIGQVDAFAEALFMLMLFVLAFLLGRLRGLMRCCPFRVSWWAVSFPLAASSTAALRYAEYARNTFSDGIAILLLAFATIVIAALLIRTIVGIVGGELRTLSA